jgi:ADP-ribosylglycohydrolase/transcriptional regulator with XRE-family HTH domain
MLLSEKIYRIRTKAGLSGEKFAGILGVTKQSVQKWEAGNAQPELSKLIKISKSFNISLDALVLDSDLRITEDMHSGNVIKPDYASMQVCETYHKNLLLEFEQCMDEGLDIEKYREVFESVQKMSDSSEKEEIADVLFRIVTTAKIRDDYKYTEPSDLQGIRLCRKDYDFDFKMPERAALENKVRGAWEGRIAGCLLGKTVECMHTDELIPFLTENGNYPMTRYISKSDATDEICEKYQYRLKGRVYADGIDCAPADDDTNYTVMAQRIIEEYGRDFKPSDVGSTWLALQSKNAYCTAEQVAFCNLVNGYRPPQSALYKNPYREWIGAQIRADYYGYINPGNPQAAAEMAWKDASVSHVKNGIYGAMFIAGVLACAAAVDTPKEALLGGLAQIPEKSRLYEKINDIIVRYENGESAKQLFAYIHEQFDEYNSHGWCHTISNAMIVTASLLCGQGDFGKSICMAVETGFDTDCNGATVGSIVGMLYGADCIDSVWTAPLNGRLKTNLFGSQEVKIEELVQKTVRHIDLSKLAPL